MGPLQREHVLRLLSASAFTRQLAGLKLLNDLVRCAVYVVQAVLHCFCWGRFARYSAHHQWWLGYEPDLPCIFFLMS